MKRSALCCACLMVLLVYSGCSSSKQFAAIPAGLDLSNIPRQTVAITAERFRFTPDIIHVKGGTLVHLDLKATNGTHGFQLSEYGIDESLDEGETKVIEFVAQQKGEFAFRCSHFCGLGHFGMKGTLIVE